MADTDLLATSAPVDTVVRVLTKEPGTSRDTNGLGYPVIVFGERQAVTVADNPQDRCTDLDIFDYDGRGLARRVFDLLAESTGADLELFDGNTAETVASRKQPARKSA